MNKREAKKYVYKHAVSAGKVYTPPFTCVSQFIVYNGKAYVAVGLARCSEEDEFSAKRGHEIAAGRANAALARQLTHSWREEIGIRVGHALAAE